MAQQIQCLLRNHLSKVFPLPLFEGFFRRGGSWRGLATPRQVTMQLDYPMSAQFAGVAVAQKQGIYRAHGVDLELLPACPPGQEPHRVRQRYGARHAEEICVGTIEQNVLVPLLASDSLQEGGPSLNMSAVAAMFARSPLCLAALPSHPTALLGLPTGRHKMVIGAHEDTVELLQSLVPHSKVVSVSREEKMGMLMKGEIDAVQVYDVMESLMLQEKLGQQPRLLPLHALGANLGYSQVIFVPNEVFSDESQSDLLKSFLKCTFDGWGEAINDPAQAAHAVQQIQAESGITSDHWNDTIEFTELSVRHCCDYVKATSRGGMLGVIDPEVWNKASKWLTKNKSARSDNSGTAILNNLIWKEDARFMYGKGLADSIREQTMSLSSEFLDKFGRKPSVSIITVGNEAHGTTHRTADRRLQLFSPREASWFSKTLSGQYLGIDVEELNLPQNTTTSQLLAEIRRRRDRDGIQLMWPLPPHIEAEVVYKAISAEQDIDGAHYIGRMETSGGHKAIVSGGVDPRKNAPVTPLAVIRLMEHYGVDIKGKRILIIGRSRIVGQPLSYMLSAFGALVTVAHEQVPEQFISESCKAADIVIPCVGLPGLLKADWIKQNAVVINVGSTFIGSELLPDIENNLDKLSQASLVATCPGSVGPLSVAILFENVVKHALQKQIRPMGATKETPRLTDDQLDLWLKHHSDWWTSQSKEDLRKTFHLQSYPLAVEFISEVIKEAEKVNHHPNWKIVHHCTEGVSVDASLFTLATNGLSCYDIEMAEVIDEIFSEGFATVCTSHNNIPLIKMKDFNYELPDDQIARFPSPRGTSRLLVAKEGDQISDLNFADIASVLPAQAHLVFNESRVFAARVYGHLQDSDANSSPFEVMFLNPESPYPNPATALSSPCLNQTWRVMVRTHFDAPGAVIKFNLSLSGASSNSDVHAKITEIHSEWCEENEDDGVEATIQLLPGLKEMLCSSLFSNFGEVPLPPYLKRKTEPSDNDTYQTVYASTSSVGSVAAPTAGLHFTGEILKDLSDKGFEMSKLSLHVGSGTFRPVTSESISDHEMHEERFEVSTDSLHAIANSIEEGRPIVPVGTTSVRVLETLYWLGVKELINKKARRNQDENILEQPQSFQLGQWDVYELQNTLEDSPCASLSFRALCQRVARSGEKSIQGVTSLCIVPGYKFAAVDALVTNFHQPDSTLLLLVAALVGDKENLRTIYKHAKENKYNFLSYGDACLLFNKR